MVDFDALVIGPCMATFGKLVSYQPLGGTPFAITGVFDEAYHEQSSIEGLLPANLTSDRPMLGVQLSQFPVLPLQDDALTILSTGVTYWVNEVRPDSHGGALLLLNVTPS